VSEENLVRDKSAVQFLVLRVNVARDGGESEVVQKVGNEVIPSVKFVVSKRDSIETKLVKRCGNLLSLEEGVKEGTLSIGMSNVMTHAARLNSLGIRLLR